MMPRAEGSILGRKTSGPANSGCAPQKVDPALIAPFRPAMLGRFVPVDSGIAPLQNKPSDPGATPRLRRVRPLHAFV